MHSVYKTEINPGEGVAVCHIIIYINNLPLPFQICGILLIVFGSLMVSEIKNFSNIDETFTANSVAIIILVLGCLIFLVAFIGCCGAIQENSCALSTVKYLILQLKHFSYGSCFCNLVLHHHAGSVPVSNRPYRLCLDKPCTNT